MSNLQEKIAKIGIIDLGWTKFHIRFVDNLPCDRQGNKTFGECDFDSYEIRIIKKLDNNFLKEVFIHEITHALQETVGLGEDVCKLNEESRCVQTSRGLLLLFNLNPKLKTIL